MPSPLAVVGRLIHSGAPPLAFGAARWLWPLADAAPLAASLQKTHQYFLGDSAPFRIERDFRTMQIVFYGDFVPMGYVCIVFPYGVGCDKTIHDHRRE